MSEDLSQFKPGKIEYGEEIMGPGFFVFFQTTVRTMPFRNGLVDGEVTTEENFEEEDLTEIIQLMFLSGVLK